MAILSNFPSYNSGCGSQDHDVRITVKETVTSGVRNFDNGLKEIIDQSSKLSILLHDLTCNEHEDIDEGCRFSDVELMYDSQGHRLSREAYMSKANHLIDLIGGYDEAMGFVRDLQMVSPKLLIDLVENEL